jgi:hypothetical protein
MSKMAVFSLGGLGGLLPVLTSVLAVDLASVIDNAHLLTVGNYAGYVIRVAILVVLGGTVALLNVEVRQPLTLVQLGIAAPALITAYINGAGITGITPPNTQHPQSKISAIFVSPAKADEPASHPSIRVAEGLRDVLEGITRPLPSIQADRAQLNRLVAQLFGDQKTARMDAYDAIIAQFSTDPNTVSALLDYAAQNPQNANGVYNTVVTLKGLSRVVTKPRKAEINRFCDQAEKIGEKTRSECDALRSSLE